MRPKYEDFIKARNEHCRKMDLLLRSMDESGKVPEGYDFNSLGVLLRKPLTNEERLAAGYAPIPEMFIGGLRPAGPTLKECPEEEY